MPRVYVIQVPNPGGHRKATYDTTPAEQYGQINYIFEAGFSPSLSPAKAIEIARKALAYFDSDTDFLVWAGGDPAGMMLVGAVAFSQSVNGDLKWLKWENNRDPETRQPNGSGHYIPITFPLSLLAEHH